MGGHSEQLYLEPLWTQTFRSLYGGCYRVFVRMCVFSNTIFFPVACPVRRGRCASEPPAPPPGSLTLIGRHAPPSSPWPIIEYLAPYPYPSLLLRTWPRIYCNYTHMLNDLVLICADLTRHWCYHASPLRRKRTGVAGADSRSVQHIPAILVTLTGGVSQFRGTRGEGAGNHWKPRRLRRARSGCDCGCSMFGWCALQEIS
jgi:hypothetical protein